jgi:SagB-type dehydrogenase family enzyme
MSEAVSRQSLWSAGGEFQDFLTCSPCMDGSDRRRPQRRHEASRLKAVKAFHERTKHHVTRYARGPEWLDWANQPDPYRAFAGTPRYDLPLCADHYTASFGAARRQAVSEPQPISPESLGAFFEMSLGLSAWKSFGGATWALRCNPSSGNLHPTEAYLICGREVGLPPGVYHYSCLDHSLERRAAPHHRSWDSEFSKEGFLLGLSSIHWREAWKYGERAFRYCQHDAGHALAALRYAAAALGWKARFVEGWSSADVSRLLGLDRSEDFAGAEKEAAGPLLSVGPSPRLPDPHTLTGALEEAFWAGTANRLSTQRVAWDAIDEVSAASTRPRIQPGSGEEARSGAPILPALAPFYDGIQAAGIFKQRRSAVAFDGTGRLSADHFFTLLDALMKRPEMPPLDVLPESSRIHLLLFVHRVDGVAPGLYCLPRRHGVEPALKKALGGSWLWEEVAGCPPHLPLRLLLRENLQEVAKIISCHQDIAADSAFSLAMLAEYGPSLEEGSWWYPRLFWEAGAVGQILYLEAEAAGFRGTGIGCFFDDEVHRLLGLADDTFQSLYHFTVGTPVEDRRLATLSPYAHLRR